MLKKILTILCVFPLVFVLTAHCAEQQKSWMLIKDENNIQVYILETDYSDIVKAKTRTIIKAPINQVKKTLDDIDHRHEWIPFLKISKALSQYNNNRRIEFSHFSAPWPASDRDFVYQIELFAESDQRLVYKMKSVVTDLMPTNENRIRADLYESIYTLKAVDKNTTEVELVFHADPKGWLPNWIINIIQRVLPYKILRNLKRRLNTGPAS